MEIGRRDFLKLTLASAAAVKAGEGGNQLGNVLQASTPDERVPNGVEKFVATACTQCPGGCGVRVRLIDTRAVKLEGNPLHPVTGGGLCPVGQAALQAVYSPDRVRGPLKRLGRRGAGQWQSIGWDEAIGTVAEQLRGLRAAGRPESLALLLGRPVGAVPDLFRRFARAYGTPAVLEGPAPDGSELALWLMQGVRRPAAYDLENARYVLSFGVPLLEGWWSPVRQMRALAQSRQGTPGRRGKLVQFEPRLSPTAARADEWVPLVPGTEGALALGIASVLVNADRYDRKFVAEHTTGFDDWSDERGKHRGFRTLLLEDYPPAAVARITGVPEETIRRIALEFVSFGPGLAIGPAGGAAANLAAAVAVHALNALVGGIERRGGVLLAPDSPPPAWPEVVPEPVAARGLAAASPGGSRLSGRALTLADLLQGPAARRPKALLVWGADPVFAGPDPDGVRHALESIPFVVSFSSFLDDTGAHADLVLPDHVFPEGWQDAPASPGLPRVVVGIGQPALEPLYQTRHTGDVVLDLARRLGGAVAAAFPWKDQREVLVSRVAALQRDGSGAAFVPAPPVGAPAPAPAGPDAKPAAAEDRAGAAVPAAPVSPDDYWNDVVARGGWAGAPYRYGDWGRVLRTPSGKFEFYSRTLRAALDAAEHPAQLVAGFGLRLGDDRLYLPHYVPRAELGDPGSYPLRLHPFTTLTLGDGGNANQPFLQEIVGPHLNEAWGSWAELNPATAARLGIADGDTVWVESPVGRVRVRARLFAGVMPEVLAIVLGQGHQQLGRYARGKGVNAAALLSPTPDPVSGAPLYLTRVKVYTA